VERSKPEEFANTLTHGIGILLVLIGSVVLIGSLTEDASIAIWIACIVYLATLLSVYVSSTLSHFFTDAKRQPLFRKLDQACIYLLIVGSYTPFSVAHLNALGGMLHTECLPRESLQWIVSGGLTYSLGTVFLFNDRKAPYLHAVWHLFVIAGSVIHFLGIVKCV